MSAQSVIDKHIKQGYYNITVKNETGDVIVPENANVHFFDCTLGKLTVKGNSAIFLGRTKVSGNVFTEDCQFTARTCEFRKEIIWKKNTIVKSISDSIFYFRITARDNSQVTLLDCTWDGSGSFGILALDKTRVTLTNCNITKREKGVWMRGGSYADMTNCTVGTAIGLIVDENSQINMVRGSLNVTTIGAKVTNKSQLYLASLDSPVKGTTYHIEMDSESKLIANSTDFAPLPPTSIKAKNNCLIEVMNSNFIKSLGDNCIDIEDECKARFINVTTIESLGASAIKAKNNCLVTAVGVTTIEGKGKYGVELSDNNTKFEGVKGDLIKGVLGGIKAENECSVSLNSYKMVQGEAEEGIQLINSSRCYLSKSTTVKSTGSNGITLSTESDISVQNHGEIIGEAGHGIQADGDCTIQIQTIKKVEGKVGCGINASKNTNVDIVYANLIEGKTEEGITVDNNCDLKITRSTKITGKLGGLSHKNNGTLTIELVAQIVGQAGVGILIEEGVNAKIKLVGIIKKGVSFTGSEVVVRNCPSITNSDGSAILIDGGELNVKKVTASGSSNAIDSKNATVDFVGVTLSGTIVSENDVYKVFKTIVSGSLAMTGSNLHSMDSSFTSIALDAASSAILMSTSGTVTGAGNVIAMNSDTVGAGMNRIEMFPANINIQNTANAQIAEVAVDILLNTTTSGGDIVSTT